MENSEDFYSENTEDFTNEDTCLGTILPTNYNKWLNSESELSRISGIYKNDRENMNEKNIELVQWNKKEEKEINNPNEKRKKEFDEENNEIEDDCPVEIKNSDEEETFEDSDNNRTSYTFIWDEMGNDVKITGSFSDWKIMYPMSKDSKDNLFKCQLSLNNEVYQYKFIVDGEWKYSTKFPTQADGNGNINNVLDNTKNALIENPKNNKKFEENNKKETKPKKETKAKNNKKQRKMNQKTKTKSFSENKDAVITSKRNNEYQSEYPSDDEGTPLPLPNKRYFETFQFEKFSKQNSIGNGKYYEYYNRCYYTNETSSKPILILGHVNLDHLIANNKKESHMSKNCMSFRYREKTSTFIYYKNN